jgi:hypothetical protein
MIGEEKGNLQGKSLRTSDGAYYELSSIMDPMKQYLALAMLWLVAAYCFVNSYYGFRFPVRYMKANWTVRRGLPPEPSSNAAAAAILSLVVGAFCSGLGYLVLRDILAHAGR